MTVRIPSSVRIAKVEFTLTAMVIRYWIPKSARIQEIGTIWNDIYYYNTSRILVSNVLFQGNTISYHIGSAGLFIGNPWGENDAPNSTDITIEKSKFLEIETPQ